MVLLDWQNLHFIIIYLVPKRISVLAESNGKVIHKYVGKVIYTSIHRFVVDKMVFDDDILISIRPLYANKIFHYNKSVELRKKFTKKKVKRAWVYSSAPVQKILGYFTLEKVDFDTIDRIWDKYFMKIGITEKIYLDYYLGKTEGVALVIDNVIQLKNKIDPYKIFDNFRPPQSYKFLSNEEIIELLLQMERG